MLFDIDFLFSCSGRSSIFEGPEREDLLLLEVTAETGLWYGLLNKVLWSFRTKFTKKDILGTKFKKKIVKFKISTLECPFVSSFILNKALSSCGIKFAQPKKVFWSQNLGKQKLPVLHFGSLWNNLLHYGSLRVIVSHCQLWVIVGSKVAHKHSQ